MNRNQEYLELTKELEEMRAPGGSVLRAMVFQSYGDNRHHIYP